jgi:asparagine synthase (glutamine-hydrolysing)
LLWKSGAVRTWKYWSIPEPSRATTKPQELNEKVLGLLRTAVKRRLIADVPVGAFLSGGLDSSLIVALAGEESRGLHTFSIGYGEPDFDELQYARLVAQQYGTTHHEFVIRPRAEELIEEVMDSIDEPVADSSAIPTFLISRETRKLAKVVLSGVGGDEMFFGYPRYLGAKLSESLPAVFRRPLANVSRLWSSQPSGRDVGGWIHRFGKGLEMEPAARYAMWTSFLDPDVRARLLPDIRPLEQSPEQQMLDLFRSGQGTALDRIFRFDVARYVPCDLLQLCDNMTMAHSLEARVPFCDVDLVYEMARTPAAIRFHGYRLKPMLRHIAKKYLPEKIVNRKKQGFMIPIGRWFRNELKDYVESQLTRNRLPAVVDFASVHNMWEEHKAGRANHTHVLWAVLLLGHWLRKTSGKHVLIG